MNEPVFRTALITGASSGLGAEYASQLARKGSNLVLVARRFDRLQALSQQLEQQFQICAQPLQADLAEDRGVEAVEECIARLPDLDLLVNNAGFGLQGSFSASPVEKQLEMIHVQVNAVVRLARAALDGMLLRDRGAIVNVSSMAAFMPLRSVTYSAVKAYQVNFSEALQNELRDTPIKVQAFCPGFVVTEFHETAEMQGFQRSSIPRLLWLNAPGVVKESLEALNGRRVVVIPSWKYKFIAVFARQPLTSSLVGFVARQLVARQEPHP
jgi:uncharacterized protein